MGAKGQEADPAIRMVDYPWYVGVAGGTSFGQSTFHSITEDGIQSWGTQGGLFGGYKFSRVFSLELGFQLGSQEQFSLECCPYWLSTTGEWEATQVIDRDGWYFKDMTVPTSWYRVSLQGNFNLISLFGKKNSRWSLDLSPQISLINTKSKWQGNLSNGQGSHEESLKAQNHIGIGGQMALGYAIGDKWKLSLYGGVSKLSGDRFDNIPTVAHKANAIWDGGIKITFSFGKNGKKARALAAAAEAARLAAEREAAEMARLAAEREAAERAAREAAEREAAERAAREAAEREAAARAEAAKYYTGTFPVIFFADNSTKLGDEAAKLDEVARILNEYPKTTITLQGFASKYGTDDYNNTITEKRLERVKDYLVSKGVDEMNIHPICNMGVDHNAARSAQARRVEIKVVDKEVAAQEREARETLARRIAAADAALAAGTGFGTIFYKDNSTVINEEGKAKLAELKDFLDKNPNLVAVLYGYASKPGTPEYNLQISERRVNKVKKYLVELGVPECRINPILKKGVDTQAKNNKAARRVNIFTVEK